MTDRRISRGLYVSDILGPGSSFTRRVDDHFFTQPVLGWFAPTGGELPLPRGLNPRKAVGVEADGRRHEVVVARTDADLWTRSSLQWTILDDTGLLQTVTATGYVGETFTP